METQHNLQLQLYPYPRQHQSIKQHFFLKKYRSLKRIANLKRLIGSYI